MPCLLVQFRFEEMVARLALRLRAVKREVGVFHQDGTVVSVRGCHGNAEACRRIHLLIVQHDSSLETGLDTVGDGGQIILRIDVPHEDGELVPAEPCNQCLRQFGTQMGGGVAQERVAGGMAERVVDRLEIVEIDIDDHQPVLAAKTVGGAIELLQKQLPVGQVGQTVMQTDMEDLALAFLDSRNHRSEAARKISDLVVGFGAKLDIATFRNGARRFVQFVQRSCDRPGHAPTERNDQHKRREPECGKRVLQTGIFCERRRQRMLQYQSRLDVALHRLDARHEKQGSLAFVDLDRNTVIGSVQTLRQRRLRVDPRCDIDRGKFDQPIQLGPVHRLHHDKPTEQRRGRDGAGSRQAEPVSKTNDAGHAAIVQRFPKRVRVERIRPRNRSDIAIEPNEKSRGARPRL